MTRVWSIVSVGLALSLLGTLTATDAISLREVFHSVPVVSTLVFAARTGMGTPLAHTLEPLCAVLGFGVMVLGASSLRVPGRAARPVLAVAQRLSN